MKTSNLSTSPEFTIKPISNASGFLASALKGTKGRRIRDGVKRAVRNSGIPQVLDVMNGEKIFCVYFKGSDKTRERFGEFMHAGFVIFSVGDGNEGLTYSWNFQGIKVSDSHIFADWTEYYLSTKRVMLGLGIQDDVRKVKERLKARNIPETEKAFRIMKEVSEAGLYREPSRESLTSF